MYYCPNMLIPSSNERPPFDPARDQGNSAGQWGACSQNLPSWFLQNGNQVPVGQCDAIPQRPSFLGAVQVHSEPTPWNHTVPLSMPWFQSNSPFPTGPLSVCQLAKRTFSQKRKGDLPEQLSPPSKQYISEEAMSSHLREMHISSNYTPVPVDGNNSNIEDINSSVTPVLSVEELHARLSGDSAIQGKESMLVLAPELSKIQTEPILPRSIVRQLHKPTMEIVLWKPPGGLVDQLIRSTLDERRSDEKKRSTNPPTMHMGASEPASTKSSSVGINYNKLFHNYKAVRVPAMMQEEIDSLEEEMNL